MSIERDDCEHGHGAQVFKLASDIGASHGIECESAVLVVIGPGGGEATVIGKFNTAALTTAASAVLVKAGQHEPDGCPTCDPAGAACAAAALFLRAEFELRTRQRSPH